jgi:GNAT superfamily N-acetyltransferase
VEDGNALVRPLTSGPGRAITVRQHRPGDMGWVVQAHGLLYWKEYGWDERFEALVARVVAGFIENLDASRERCWIAERDGVNVGCIFLVRHAEREGVAQLRLFLIDPATRGMGLGQRLVDECIAFARSAGYRAITLWTQDTLHTARHLYMKAGFELKAEEKHNSFGHELNAQVWELTLA